jgi:hypothetical protein
MNNQQKTWAFVGIVACVAMAPYPPWVCSFAVAPLHFEARPDARDLAAR